MRLATIIFTCVALLTAAVPRGAGAENLSYVVKVNGDPITSYDVSQRQKVLALTSGLLGKRMNALLQSPETKRKFEQFVRQQQPQSRAEARALQKQYVNRLQQQVMQEIRKQTRGEAIEQLVDERLMFQEAKRMEVSVSQGEVNERLAQMAQSGNKRSAEEFLAAFQKQGVDPETMRTRIRAQLVWRDTVRKLYGFRIASVVGSGDDPTNIAAANARDTTFDVARLRLTAGGTGRAPASAYVQAQSIRKQFASCDDLNNLASRARSAELQRHNAKKAEFFPRDARPLLLNASAGQMLPPIITSRGVDLYAVCAKTTPKVQQAGESRSGEAPGDRRQEEFEIYARRHLKDLRQDALIERR